MYLVPGILGFIACCMFDMNKILWNKKALNLFFVLGSLLLIVSTVICILQSDPAKIFSEFGIYPLTMLIGLILSCAAEVYALFFALPFSSTYTESKQVPVVESGWYRVCRHPGFWTLMFVYLFLWLLLGGHLLFYMFITYTFCNLLYVIMQDLYIFPQYIRGYNDYKKTVPFLIPTRDSIRYLFSPNQHKN